MGMMNKMRDRTKVILWILIFAFGVIWVLQDSGGLDVIGSLGTNVGSVNGDPITFEEYSLAVDNQARTYQNQTGNTMPVQMLDQTRDRIFNQLVEDKLRMQEMQRLGLDVADLEILDMVQGENPHPIITFNFGDGEGNVDRALLQNFIENPDRQLDWIQIEEFLRGERRRSKLDGLITGTVRVSAAEIDAEYQQRNRKVDVRFVSSRFTSIPDDSISYDDSDLRRFYNAHKDEFKRKRSYTFSYVTISKNPTAGDSAAVLSDLESIRESLASTQEDSLFLSRNGSERPYVDVYFKPNELDDVLADAIFEDAAVGTVVGPLLSGNQAHLIKILDVREPVDPAIEARHILFRADEDDDDAQKSARDEANEILGKLRDGETFAVLARLHSDDPRSASRGGSLGWFGKGRMPDGFNDAAFKAPIGRVIGPVKTESGYHIIEVIDRAEIEVKIADFALSLRASVGTLNRVQEELDDLLYFSSESGDFEEEAGHRSLAVRSVQVEHEQRFIPGIGNSRPLMNFLETASAGDLSEVIELDNQFLAVTVDEIKPDGVRPFEEVRSQIEPRLRNQIKGELLAERMRDALENGYDGLADAIGTTERTGENLSFSNMIVDGIGRDPEFVGTAMGLSQGAVSNVIVGMNSVYVIKIESSVEPAPPTEEDREQIYAQLLSRRQNLLRNQWISTLRDQADIIDSRRLFLQ